MTYPQERPESLRRTPGETCGSSAPVTRFGSSRKVVTGLGGPPRESPTCWTDHRRVDEPKGKSHAAVTEPRRFCRRMSVFTARMSAQRAKGETQITLESCQPCGSRG